MRRADSDEPLVGKKRRNWKERVFSPLRLLVYFAFVQLLTYFDRGAISGTLADIQVDPTILGIPIDQTYTPCMGDYPINPGLAPMAPAAPSAPTAPSGAPSTQSPSALGEEEEDQPIIMTFTPTPTPEAPQLSKTLSGLLGSGFMCGFMIFCPLFAWAANYANPIVLVAVGLSAWTISAVGCGLAPNYWILLLCRVGTGIGEASFVGIAPTLLDNVAPPSKRTVWFAVFYCMVPVGQAAGIGASAAISAAVGAICEPLYFAGWRVVFVIEAICMSPFIVGSLLIPNSYNKPVKHESTEDTSIINEKVMDEEEGEKVLKEGPTTLLEAIKVLGRNYFFLITCYGYSCYTFVIGGIAFWAPNFTHGVLDMSNTEGSIIFGGITAFTGLFGTFAGGFIIDKMGGSKGLKGIANCAKFGAICFGATIPFGFLALLVPFRAVFFPAIFIAEFIVFLPTSSTNTMLITMVPPWMRTYAMSINVFSIHLLGDFPSPFLAGGIADTLTAWEKPGEWIIKPLSIALGIVWFVMVPCFISFFVVWKLAKNRPGRLAQFMQGE